MSIKFLLISLLIPLQACSNTLIGEKLENSFDITKNSTISEKANKIDNKPDEIKKNKINSARLMIQKQLIRLKVIF